MRRTVVHCSTACMTRVLRMFSCPGRPLIVTLRTRSSRAMRTTVPTRLDRVEAGHDQTLRTHPGDAVAHGGGLRRMRRVRPESDQQLPLHGSRRRLVRPLGRGSRVARIRWSPAHDKQAKQR